jgi:DNA-binding NarL/FixJ family response regulator
MRSLMAARLVLLDADQVRREELSGALAELGAFQISGIATVAEAAGVCALAAPDLFIVEGPSLAANDEDDEISANPFAASGIPTILLIPDATMLQRRKAARAGYAIVIGMPASPRLVYRRIAHALQNARRVKRRLEATMLRDRAKTAAETREGAVEKRISLEAPLFAKRPAR